MNSVFVFGLFFAFFDQLSKIFVQNYTPLPIAFNTGVAFSIPIPQGIQIAVTIILLLCIIVFGKKFILSMDSLKKQKYVILALALIFGGGLGNLMDRINLGHVVDFIDVGFWPVFNLADSFVTIGAIVLGVLLVTTSSPKTS
jgi:signal peptidase II